MCENCGLSLGQCVCKAGGCQHKFEEYKEPEKKKGIKFDSDKTKWRLLPWKQIEHVVKVLMFGIKKGYPPNNWKYVEDGETRYFEALIRHALAYESGQKIDPESGLPHLAHAVCCALFMMWFDDNTKTS
jgi:hypothetical protein